MRFGVSVIKRIAGLLLLDGGMVINSYGFKTHLPVGKLRPSLLRLQELKIDEIIILNTDHSVSPEKDFISLYSDFHSWHVSTPISYGGGISNLDQAKSVIRDGADRVVVSLKTLLDQQTFFDLGDSLGEQAIIVHLPLYKQNSGIYVQNSNNLLLKKVLELFPEDWGGEILVTAIINDGALNPDWDLMRESSVLIGDSRRLILSGGFASFEDILDGLKMENVESISIGNLLHRMELSVVHIKNFVSREVGTR
jgi:imidazole glycerol phosphate synthase subunit HisF